jgi:uncharacterized membrane protein (UPF0182 family)
VAADRWVVSPTNGAGSPAQTIKQSAVFNTQGIQVGTNVTPMDPLYQVGALPGTGRQQLTLSVAYVPAGGTSQVTSLSGFLMATSDPGEYGRLHLYVIPKSTEVTGPTQADAFINQNPVVSSKQTLLGQHGSEVLLGNNLMIPLDHSILYVRPFYTASVSNPLPQLKFVVAVFNQQVGIESTLAGRSRTSLG